PLGIIDVLFGTLQTVVSVLFIIGISKSKANWLWLASLGAIIGTPLIGYELNIMFQLPFVISTLWVALGEFVVVTIVGVPVFTMLGKTKVFHDII
ncbi:QueT transporter family protein, partial [Treponema sp. R6D11]